MMFRFAHPLVLFALLLALAAACAYRYFRKPPAMTYPATSSLLLMAGTTESLIARIPQILRLCCLVLLILAASRPQLYNVSREVTTPGVDIMLSLDTSGSMRALDFQLDGRPVTRLTAVKKVVSDFISRRPDDRIGIVVFGEQAFTQAPLTMDKGLLLTLVEKMTIGMAGDATAIGTALAIGGKRLKDLPAKSKILILLTDGNSNAGDVTPAQAAEALKSLGIKVYTIGVGGKEDAPFEVNTIFGKRIVYQRVDLDEKTLQEIAGLTGGRYFPASDTDQLSEIYDIIDQEEKTEVRVKEFFHFKELYLYFLIPALILLGLEIIFKMTIVKVVP